MSASFVKGVSENYKQLLTEFLFRLFDKRSGIKEVLPRYINEDTIYKFALALTHVSYDNNNNYEYYETLGDTTLNKCTVWYFHRRFPLLRTLPDGNYRMTLLKTQNVSKMSFAELSKKTGVDSLIRYNPTYTVNDKEKHVLLDNKLRTDTFESLMGCIEDTIDDVENLMGVGSSIVYNIFSSLMDEIPFSIEVEDLVDPKTSIIQLFSKRKADTINFEETSNVITIPEQGDRKEYTFSVKIKIKITNPINNKVEYLTFGPSVAKTKLSAQKQVSKIALDYLKKNFGIV